MPPPSIPASARAPRTASPVARHQSAGSCSAQPGRGVAKAACSVVAEPTIRPDGSITSARVPLVPTSIPRKFMAGILLFPVHCTHNRPMAKLTKAVDTGAPEAGSPSEDVVRPPDRVTTEHVVAHVRALIEKGELRPGDRLPPERELAVQIGVSRPS